MTPLFAASRAAEEFDQVLAGTAPPAVADRYVELLDTVSTLRTQPVVIPRAEFVDDLRSRLMTAARTELVAAPTGVRPLERALKARNNRRFGTAAAALVIVGGTAGMAAAASGSMPGEALYPVKRGVENADVAIHLGGPGKGRVLLDQAATRLEEVRALQSQRSADPRLAGSTLESFSNAAEAGAEKLFKAYQADGDTQNITSVRSFTAAQMDSLATLSTTSEVPDEGLADAADTVADIDQQARVLCAACTPGAALTPPASLSSAAAAATLDNLLARPVVQARADIARASAADRAQIAQLRAAAQKAAGTIPTAQQLAKALAEAKAQAAAKSDSGSPEAPVASTLTEDGTLVPAVPQTIAPGGGAGGVTSGVGSAGTAVQDLVTGLTTTVDGVSTAASGDTSTLDPVLKGVGDDVDKTVGGLLPTPPGN